MGKALVTTGGLSEGPHLFLIPPFLLTWFVWLWPIPDGTRRDKAKPDVGGPSYSPL